MFPKPEKQKGTKRKKWGSKELYMRVCREIYEERGGRCEVCSVQIQEMKWHNFNHTKGRREHFTDKDSIQLLCFTCHSEYHGIREKNGQWLN